MTDKDPYWQPWWDSPGLPPRRVSQRCWYHSGCAYRDDDPALCARCHVSIAKGCGHVPATPESRSEGLSGGFKPHPTLRSGDRVWVERDETLYPSRGTWPRYRGRTGTVVSINRAGAGATEYGVVFGATRERGDGSLQGGMLTWFKRYELTRTAR